MPGPIAEEDFDAEILYDDPVVVVAGANNPWTRRRKVQLADLVNELWVMPKSDSSFWLSLIKAFCANGLTPPRATVTTSSGHVRSSFLATGRFLSVRPRSVLWFQGDQPSLKALPVKLPTTHRPIAIVTLKNRTLSPVAQLFIDTARELGKPLAKSKS